MAPAQEEPFLDTFSELLRFRREPRKPINALHPKIVEVVRAHGQNSDRIGEVVRFSLLGAGIARQETMWLAQACYAVGVAPTDVFLADDPNGVRVREEYARIKAETGRPNYAFNSPEHDMFSLAAFDRAGTDWSIYGFQHSLQAVLQSQVVATWTTFEILATDLWVAAVNAAPSLASPIVTDKIPKTQPNDDGIEDREVGKTFSVKDVARYDFDVKHRMGDLLKGRYGFLRLDRIRRAYAETFPATPKDDDTERGLELLESLRNVIVHRGCVADAKFVASIRKQPLGNYGGIGGPLFAKAGHQVELNCSVVAKLTSLTLKRCGELIELVDSTLKKDSG